MLTIANNLPALSVFCMLQTSATDGLLSVLTNLIGVSFASTVVSLKFIFIGDWLRPSQDDLPSYKTVPHLSGKAHFSL